MNNSTKITAYKGFDPDFKCRGFQFEVGKTYKVEGEIVACENGFHACENPFDVWGYYGVVTDNAKLNRFALVEQSGAIDKHGNNTKVASAEITIKAELTLPEFIKAAIRWILDATKGRDGDGSSGNYTQIGSSGNYTRIGSSGDDTRIGSSGNDTQIGSSGNDTRIGSSGNYTRIGSSGDDTRIGSSGDGARIGSSGDDTRIGSSGDGARIGSSGNCTRIGSSGDGARIVSEGRGAVIASAGSGTIFSAKDGTHVALAEYDNEGRCLGFVTGCVGQDGIKPDTPYIAKGGRFVEV